MNPRLNRRFTLGGIGAALLAACAHPALAKWARCPLGLTDITVRKELAADYAGTLRAVAALGYSHFGFRLSDYAPDSTEPSAAEKARMVRDAGLALGPVRLNPVGEGPGPRNRGGGRHRCQDHRARRQVPRSGTAARLSQPLVGDRQFKQRFPHHGYEKLSHNGNGPGVFGSYQSPLSWLLFSTAVSYAPRGGSVVFRDAGTVPLGAPLTIDQRVYIDADNGPVTIGTVP